ncbi:MAG: putative signal-transduction protein with domain [Betaproteobacteria bacterium]|nr:putative signal-transduction protein with domain [Betaproteobacteria bacterium]
MEERTVLNSMPQQRVISVGPEATVHKAAIVMTQANCGSVLVLGGDGALQGILTERDLMTRVVAKALDPAATLVATVMTRNPICIPPETTVSDAIVIMIERGFRHLPVVRPGGKIVGVFSVRDALPREVGTAVSLAEFNEQMNDAGGG